MKTQQRVKDARKIKYTIDQITAIKVAMELYIDSNDMPTLAQFVTQPEIRHKYKLARQYCYDHPEIFEQIISVMIAKSEDYLVRQGLNGRAIPMTIFMLKQLQYGGYSDQQQIDLTSKTQPIKFINSVPRPKKSPKV